MIAKRYSLSKMWKYVGYFSIGIFFVFLALRSFTGLTSSFVPFFAHAEVALCSHAPDKAACYEANVPKLMQLIPVESIFPVIREIQKEDLSYRFCHVLAHKLGENEVTRNTDAWVRLMHKNPPDSLCSNGYIHGIIVGRFHKDELLPDQIAAIEPELARACETGDDWHPTDLDKAMCYHGMGHVLTFITGANMPLASSYCKKIAVKESGEDYSQTCISGVFMQIFQPLEPEDFALIARLPMKPSRDTLTTFCSAYSTEEERSLCFGEGWPLFREDLKTAEGVQTFCTTSKDVMTQTNCYRTAFAIGARGSLGNPEKQSTVCAALPLSLGQQCFGVLAEAFVEEDRTAASTAVSVCAHAPDIYRESCYGYLVKLVTFTFGDDQVNTNRFCAALPIPWQEKCVAQGGISQ